MKLVIVAVLLGLASPAFAQAPPDRAARKERRHEKMLARFDHNHDGRLDRAERREAKEFRREKREQRRLRREQRQSQAPGAAR